MDPVSSEIVRGNLYLQEYLSEFFHAKNKRSAQVSYIGIGCETAQLHFGESLLYQTLQLLHAM
jgi:hypothetical protein